MAQATTLSTICDQHDLLSATITRHRAAGRNHSWFNCALQWADETKEHGRGIATGDGHTESEALKAALVQMGIIRTLELELVA